MPPGAETGPRCDPDVYLGRGFGLGNNDTLNYDPLDPGEFRPRRTGRLFVTLTQTTARQSGVREAASSQVSRRCGLPSLSADAVPELSKLKECASAPPPLQALEMHLLHYIKPTNVYIATVATDAGVGSKTPSSSPSPNAANNAPSKWNVLAHSS